MFISNNKNPKHALRKGRSLRKPILAIAVAIVFCLLPIFSGLIGTFNHANAEVEQADWDKPLYSQDYWPLAESNRFTIASFSSEPVRNPSLEYVGTYLNTEGRTVVRLVYRRHNSSHSMVWTILALRAREPFDSLIDWNNQKTVAYYGFVRNGRHCWFESEKNKESSRFKDSPVDKVGATRVHEIDMKANKNEDFGTGEVGNRAVAIDLVLKEGKTLSDMKLNGQGVNGSIEMRLMANEDERRVYVTPRFKEQKRLEKKDTPYYAYTWPTVIPYGGTSLADSVDWKFGLQDDIQIAGIPEYTASNAYLRYGVDKSGNKYIDFVHRMAKKTSYQVDYNGRPFAYRNTFSPAFADMLKPITYVDEKGNKEHNIVAIVFPGDVKDQAYPAYWDDKTDMPYKDKSVRISVNDNGVNYINTSPDGKFKYIEVAKKADDGFVKPDGTSSDPASKIATNPADINGTIINYGASGFTGRPTIVRYYIDENKLNRQTFNNIMFYGSLLSANDDPGFTAYRGETTSEIIYKAGSVVNIDFDDDVKWDPTDVNDVNGQLQLVIGEKMMGIDFKSRIRKPKPVLQKKHYEWTVPFDIKIPAGTKIRLVGDSDNYRKGDFVIGGVTLSDGKQTLRLSPSANKDIRPQIIQYADTMAITQTLLTSYKPNIQEIFTDDTKIVGHTYYAGALAEILGGNGNMNVTIPYDLINGKSEQPAEPVVVNGKTKQGYKFTFEKPSANPEQNGWPSLEKDMPITFNNTDFLKNAVPSESVVEQVQAKVVFDLNGGTMSASGTSAPASYTKRTTETDSITRIAPLNANYRKIKDNTGKYVDNPEYKQNGFETAEGAHENRRMVGGVLADHDDKALTGDNLKYRQFVSQTPEAPEGKYFKEWNTKPDGTGTKFEKTTPIDSGMTVYAIYEDQIPTGILPTQKKAIDLLLPISLVSIMATFALILRKRVKKAQN